jgi:alpha-N-arabinofuranosidase
VSKIPRGLDAITFHYYTIPGEQWKHKGNAVGFAEPEWISTLAHTLAMDDFITHNSESLKNHDPANKVGFAVDEWGTWYDTEPGREPGFLYQQNTLRDALVAAVNLNIFHRHADRVRLAAIAQMVNVLQAMILTDGARMVLTPTYHVFSMFRPFQDATLLPTDLKAGTYAVGGFSVPQLSVSAARTAGGIVLALVNLDPHHAVSVSAALTGFNTKQVSGSVLTASAMDARNTFEAPAAVQPKAFTAVKLDHGKLNANLPPKSVVVLSLE